jgi:Ca2+-binding RTX toxin-like protein
LVFDARSGTIGGTPPVGGLGDLSLRIMASDSLGASAATPLTLRIVATTGSSITGTAGNDVLNGKSGNDWLNGGTGADTMSGGQGDDTYVVDDAGDLVIESLNEGVDSVQSSVSHTLAKHVEHLTLTGIAPINGTGNELNNQITGNSGNNVLNGGLGADTLVGGLGDDSYTVDRAGDQVIEAADEGNDIVHSPISWVLGDHLERLYLTGSDPPTRPAMTSPTRSTGRPTAPPTCSPAVWATTSTHLGARRPRRRRRRPGHDSVYGYGSEHTLAANVENLYLAVTTAATLTGNELANSLRGNAGDDRLIGLDGNDTLNGGLGADTLVGGLGDDSYTVDQRRRPGRRSGRRRQRHRPQPDQLGPRRPPRTALPDRQRRLTDATGNDLANTLYGQTNSAANLLTGGLGQRHLSPWRGDRAVENADQGNDSVYGYGSEHTLAANVENLYLAVTTPPR